uniref:Ig-like domain-containing protein n=1 Tax=Cyprinodon variegatus TaxID=28743 RepID=A0A3Q2EJL1_CYPVA
MDSIQSGPVIKRPGETLSLSCRGSGFTFTCCTMNWIRQPPGKGLEWIGEGYSNPSTSYYKDSLRNKFSIDVDTSSKTVTLNGQNMQPEDSAVYYCARRPQ